MAHTEGFDCCLAVFFFSYSWQCHLTKYILNFFCLLFSDCCHKLTLFFSLGVPLVLTFMQIVILPFFYATVCFHLEDKSVFVCSIYVVTRGRIEASAQKSDILWVIFSAQSGVTTIIVLKCHCRAGEECQRMRHKCICHNTELWYTSHLTDFCLHTIFSSGFWLKPLLLIWCFQMEHDVNLCLALFI